MKFQLFNFQLIKKYFKKTSYYSIPRYVIEITAVIYALKFLTVFIWLPIEWILNTTLGYVPDLGQNMIEEVDQFDSLTLFTFVTIVPLVETLTGQWIPIWLTSFFTKKIIIKILVSSIIFGLFHVYPFLIITIFPAGILLAWSFILFRRRSRKYAFFVTSAVHALHNTIALLLQLLT